MFTYNGVRYERLANGLISGRELGSGLTGLWDRWSGESRGGDLRGDLPAYLLNLIGSAR